MRSKNFVRKFPVQHKRNEHRTAIKWVDRDMPVTENGTTLSGLPCYVADEPFPEEYVPALERPGSLWIVRQNMMPIVEPVPRTWKKNSSVTNRNDRNEMVRLVQSTSWFDPNDSATWPVVMVKQCAVFAGYVRCDEQIIVAAGRSRLTSTKRATFIINTVRYIVIKAATTLIPVELYTG